MPREKRRATIVGRESPEVIWKWLFHLVYEITAELRRSECPSCSCIAWRVSLGHAPWVL